VATVDSKNRLTKPFVQDSKIIFTLPLGGKIRKGNIILTGTVVVSGVTAAGTASGEGGPINLVKRVIVTATPAAGSRYPGGKIVDCSARSLLRFAIFQHNGKFIGEQSGSTLGNGANGTYSIYLSIPIYWADPTLRNSIAAALNTDPGTYASVQVEVDTGDLTSCFVGNNGTVSWAGLQVQWKDDRVALAGDTLVRYQEDHVMLIAATQQRALDEAMPLNGNFESWLLMQEQGASYTLSNNLLQRVTVDGPTIGYDEYTQDIQQDMLDNEWVDPSQGTTGLVFIDWTDGVINNTIPAGSLQTKFQVTNVSGANLDDLLIYTRRVLSPAPAK
jgi:hypothetical protein